jgi:TatD DNase family protein
MFVDSHVNLHGEAYADDLDEVVSRAREAGVSTQLNICGKLSDIDAVLTVAEAYEDMWASVGTHPHDAKDNPDILPADIITFTDHPKVIGIGETGLDFHYNFSDRDVQLANFQAHIEAARETQLPLIIHSRNADDDMGDILERELARGKFPALLHCYTSGERLARRAIEMDLYFSMSGIVTFKNANEVRAVAEIIPQNRLLIETDCPYLAPVPYRGRRNEPAYVTHVAEKIAELRNWNVEDTAKITSDNFFELFKKAKRTSS